MLRIVFGLMLAFSLMIIGCVSSDDKESKTSKKAPVENMRVVEDCAKQTGGDKVLTHSCILTTGYTDPAEDVGYKKYIVPSLYSSYLYEPVWVNVDRGVHLFKSNNNLSTSVCAAYAELYYEALIDTAIDIVWEQAREYGYRYEPVYSTSTGETQIAINNYAKQVCEGKTITEVTVPAPDEVVEPYIEDMISYIPQDAAS